MSDLSYSIDVIAALCSGTAVTPLVAIIDKSIIAHASGTEPLYIGLKKGLTSLLTQPHVFIKQKYVHLIWMVYVSTYLAANTIETTCVWLNRSWQGPKFIGTSITNIGMSVYKDRQFTRMFGSGTPKALPLASYFLFFSRDAMTIGASFNIPTLLSAHMQNVGISRETADISAQLITPCAVQFFSTPLHLTALDLYNRPQAKDRLGFIAKNYIQTVSARLGRIFPAYGLGGVGNSWIKTQLRRTNTNLT
jgi:hypothetical protein